MRAEGAAVHEPLDLKVQLALAMSACGLLVFSLYQFRSPILLLAPLLIAVGWWVLQTPFRSICTYIVVTDVLTIRPKADGVDGAPTVLDLILGLVLAAIAFYWIFRIKLWEGKQLSVSRSHLLIALYFVWLIPVTIGGIVVLNAELNPALREILNLLPLLILPVLYGRYVKPDSREESIILALVVISGAVVVAWNIHSFRSNLAHAFYLYQTGRAAYDLALTCITIFAMTSALMVLRKRWQTLLAMALLLFALGGLAISMTRALYLGVIMGVIVMLFLGQKAERRRGVGSLSKLAGLGLLSVAPVYITSRLFRLVTAQFVFRFLTTSKAAHDPSLLNRFVEWREEWFRILASPVFGNGFGSEFRFYNIITQHHEWTGFSHNSYLYILFKTGFPGGILFFTACAGLVVKAFSMTREPRLSERSRTVLRVCIASILTQLFYAFSGPMFDSKPALMWFGLTWGVVASLDLTYPKNSRPSGAIATTAA